MNNPTPANQYNYPLPKVGITASQVGKRIVVSLGGSFQQLIWVELNNESPYVLSIFSSQGILLQSLQPQVVDIAQLPSGDSFFVIVPNLLIPQASPSSEVDINVYPFGKPEGPYPFPLGRQATSIGPESSVSGFCIDFLSNVASNGVQAFKFANVSTTKNLIFYLLVVTTTQAVSSTPNVEIGWISNTTDLAVTGFNASSNNGTLVATSVARITAQSTALNTLTQSWFITFVQPGLPFNLIIYPDKKLVPPGASLGVNIANGVNAATWLSVIAWTEQ